MLGWIARGIIAADNRDLDAVLIDTVWPVVRTMKRAGATRWYTSRREPQEDRDFWRARLYLQAPQRLLGSLGVALAEALPQEALTWEEVSSDSAGINFGVLQRACEVSRDLLPAIAEMPWRWRFSADGFEHVRKRVADVPRVHNALGIHWIENNLGLPSRHLMDRFIARGAK